MSTLKAEVDKIDQKAFLITHSIKDTKGGMIKTSFGLGVFFFLQLNFFEFKCRFKSKLIANGLSTLLSPPHVSNLFSTFATCLRIKKTAQNLAHWESLD